MYYVKAVIESLAAGLTAGIAVGVLRKSKAAKPPKTDER